MDNHTCYLLTLLLVSRGVPMLLSGDEFANTQYGNNNTYCQDNEVSWLDWNLLSKNKDLFSYVRKLGSLGSLRAQDNRPFLTENERTGSFSGRAEPRDDIRGKCM